MNTSATASSPPACGLDHIFDRSNHYPGEDASIFTRIALPQGADACRLEVSIPAGLELQNYQVQPAPVLKSQSMSLEEGVQTLYFHLDPGRTGETCLLEIQVQVQPTERDLNLISHARLLGGKGEHLAEESAMLQVLAKGRYLRYLPEIYRQDELMGRFLMLFESFWSPIENQIVEIDRFFDPAICPPEFLPWLGSWLGSRFDRNLPVERQRSLLKSAVTLYRCRGTRPALQQYLEIYTGGRVEIHERCSSNFRLGASARLGPGIALGRQNMPNTFTVDLYLPEPPPEAPSVARSLRRQVEAIIESQKPAHTAYSLQIHYLPSTTSPAEPAGDQSAMIQNQPG
ncbi:MAG TPA: phage tail protein I [Anaerolineaceae bacterium]